MLTMRPSRRFFRYGITRRVMRTAPMTLRFQSACQVSSPTSSKAPAAEVPALLKRMSTFPHCAITALTSASQSAARLTSATWASTCSRVALRISSAAFSRCSLRRRQQLGSLRHYRTEATFLRLAQRVGASSPTPTSLDQHAWQQHCHGLFQAPATA